MRKSRDTDESQTGERSALLRDSWQSSGDAVATPDDDMPNVPVTVWRGIAIGFSLGILIFLQGEMTHMLLILSLCRAN